MEASNARRPGIVLPIVLAFCLMGTVKPLALSAAQSAEKPGESTPAAPASPDAKEQSALDAAFRSAENNPQIVIKNLEAFLDQFPQTSRRELVLRTICAYAVQANAPGVIVQYGQMLLKLTPEDPTLLNLLVETLGRESDPASHALAIEYASRLVTIAETQRDRAATPGANKGTRDQWAERIAGLYDQRAGLYRDSGDFDKAFADDEKSYATYPTAQVAEQLGDAALKKGDSKHALDYYLNAFVFPDKSPDPARRQEVRRKLGSLYVELHHSEAGLGDLVLSHYDAIVPQLAERFSDDQPQNAGRHDPFEFVLEHMDGTPLAMAGYRGKVMVVEFWATWCGPCRLEGKLIEQVADSFRADASTAFLSLNVDHDRRGVPAFLKKQGWTVPVAYAQGMDQLMSVRELPTLVVFDRQGQVVYREEGVNPRTFVQDLSKHIREALQAAGSKQ